MGGIIFAHAKASFVYLKIMLLSINDYRPPETSNEEGFGISRGPLPEILPVTAAEGLVTTPGVHG